MRRMRARCSRSKTSSGRSDGPPESDDGPDDGPRPPPDTAPPDTEPPTVSVLAFAAEAPRCCPLTCCANLFMLKPRSDGTLAWNGKALLHLRNKRRARQVSASTPSP